MLVELKQLCDTALEKAFPGVGVSAVVTQATNAKFGDYQCNSAMSLFSVLKGRVIFRPNLSISAVSSCHKICWVQMVGLVTLCHAPCTMRKRSRLCVAFRTAHVPS